MSTVGETSVVPVIPGVYFGQPAPTQSARPAGSAAGGQTTAPEVTWGTVARHLFRWVRRPVASGSGTTAE
jgi:hypothetical protein